MGEKRAFSVSSEAGFVSWSGLGAADRISNQHHIALVRFVSTGDFFGSTFGNGTGTPGSVGVGHLTAPDETLGLVGGVPAHGEGLEPDGF